MEKNMPRIFLQENTAKRIKLMLKLGRKQPRQAAELLRGQCRFRGIIHRLANVPIYDT